MSQEVKALICPICQNKCSSQAAACPKCGHPINRGAVANKNPVEPDGGPQRDSSRTALGILWTLFIISLLFGLTAIDIYNNMLYDAGPSSRAARQADIIKIVVYIAIPAVLGLILLVVYAVRGKR